MKEIVLVGAGNMGGALLKGWLTNWRGNARFHVVDPVKVPSARHDPAGRVQYVSRIDELPALLHPELVVIAVKPDKVCAIAKSLDGYLTPDTIIVSVAAGVTTDSIRDAVPVAAPIVRVMPNIGAMVGYAVSAGFAGTEVPAVARRLVTELFASVGQMSWLDKEDDLHLVTAISGSGPAYYFAFCEAFIATAEAQGLSHDTGKLLAIGTAIAAGRLLAETSDPRRLREQVTSPNGTTAAGLEALEAGANSLNRCVGDAVVAASKRSVEL